MFANLAVASWIKFDDSVVAAALVTGIMAASMLAAALFHRKCEFFGLFFCLGSECCVQREAKALPTPHTQPTRHTHRDGTHPGVAAP